MRLVTRRRAASATIALFVILAAYFVARPFVHGLTFVIRAAEMQGTVRRIADLDTNAER